MAATPDQPSRSAGASAASLPSTAPGRLTLGVGAHAVVVPALALRVDVPLSRRWSVGPVVSAGASLRSFAFERVRRLSAGAAGHLWLLGDQATGVALGAQAHYRFRQGLEPTQASATETDPALRAVAHGVVASLGVGGRKQLGLASVELSVSASRETLWVRAEGRVGSLQRQETRWGALVQLWLGLWL